MKADTYTHGHTDSVLRSHNRRTVENSAAYLIPHLAEGLTLLDVGAGPGTITIDLARRLGTGEVVGIDVSAEIMDKAQAAVPADVTNVRFQADSVYALSFADNTFDIVHAHQVLQHLSDPVAALHEMKRVCKPGGIVAVRDADYRGMTWAPADPVLDQWMEIYQQVARTNDAEPDAGRYLLGWAQQVGFTSISPTASVWCFTNDDDRSWWGTLWADRLLDSSLPEQALQRSIATQADLEDVSAAFRRWIDAPGAWFTCPHGEIIAVV